MNAAILASSYNTAYNYGYTYGWMDGCIHSINSGYTQQD
jgi:hypothetical protein